jgi:hypothetical protein
MTTDNEIRVDPEFTFRGRKASEIPMRMRNSIELYVNYGVPPGDFLGGIICKDLPTCMDHADDENLWLIPLYYAWFYNEAPSWCWGTCDKMSRWMIAKQKGE